MSKAADTRAPEVLHADATQELASESVDLMQALLGKGVSVTRQRAPLYGIVIASVTAILPNGRVTLAIPSLAMDETSATPACAIDTLSPGCAVAVMFEQGDITRALIIGAMAAGQQTATQLPAARHAVVDNERVVIEAEQEIELRCGDAAIILTRDGRILLRGAYISSHASATQRILGGSVQIN